MKSYADVEKEVITLMAKTLGRDTAVIDGTSRIIDLSEDSIQLFELLIAFEKQYDTKTTYEDVVRMDTVKDVVDYVARVRYGHQ